MFIFRAEALLKGPREAGAQWALGWAWQAGLACRQGTYGFGLDRSLAQGSSQRKKAGLGAWCVRREQEADFTHSTLCAQECLHYMYQIKCHFQWEGFLDFPDTSHRNIFLISEIPQMSN